MHEQELQPISLDPTERALIGQARSCPFGTVTTQIVVSKSPASLLRCHLAAVELERRGYLQKIGMTPERIRQTDQGLVRFKCCVWELTDKARAEFMVLVPPGVAACGDARQCPYTADDVG